MDVNTFFLIAAFAVLIEAVTSYIKLIVVEHKIQWQVVATIVIGVVMALVFQVDLFALIGFTTIMPVFAFVLTGIILSRGANYVFDLIKLILNITNKLKETKE